MADKKIGITGQNGFIGSYLYHFLKLQEGITLVDFEKRFFSAPESLQSFVSECDVVIHMAGVNRAETSEEVYEGNTSLAQSLLDALNQSKNQPHLIFASSVHESRGDAYGRGKKEARELLAKHCESNNSQFHGLLIPNVFGPFGKPFYNSVVATFCHQLTHEETPEVKVDATIDLIYVHQLAEEILALIGQKSGDSKYTIAAQHSTSVSQLLKKLMSFRELYLKENIIPPLDTPFDVDLFNTFRSYIPAEKNPVFFKMNTDERGSLTEILKENSGGQIFYSTTKPGITRGNHFHTRKIERFCVVKGEAIIRYRRIGTEKVFEFSVSGKRPSFIDMPVWYTHNITNVGEDELFTLFWSNEFFDKNNPDTYYENV